MNRIIRACSTFALVLTVGSFAGCGQSPGTSTEAKSQPATPQAQPNPQHEEVSNAAADFLDAVLKGDSQRASARLTPEAIQRIIASGKQFAPPGLDTASFRIAQVRTPAEGQAIVQCVLSDAADDATHNEEMCCLMRQVDNDWRVSGIAYGTSPDQPWTLSNFETGQNIAIPRMTSGTPATAGQPAAPGGRPSPPRTAQEAEPLVR